MEDTKTIEERNAQDIEDMLRTAEDAGEPGEFVKDRVIHRGDEDIPVPVVALPVESAGYTWVYDTVTGVPSRINNNMLRTALKKKRPDGTYVFSLRQTVKPTKGQFKCMLHKDDTNRSHYDDLGFIVCPKDNLLSPFHVRRHMEKRHKVEWAAIEQERIDTERREDRELQRLILSSVAKETVKEATVEEVPKYTCDVCGEEFTVPIALSGHKRKHK